MDLRKAIRVLVTASAIDAAMAGCSWYKLKPQGLRAEDSKSDAKEATLSSIQLTTPLLCFFGMTSCQGKAHSSMPLHARKRLRLFTFIPHRIATRSSSIYRKSKALQKGSQPVEAAGRVELSIPARLKLGHCQRQS